MKSLRVGLSIFIVMFVPVIGCDEIHGMAMKSSKVQTQGGLFLMKSYGVGRFNISVPIEMCINAQSTLLRKVQIDEMKWRNQSGRIVSHDIVWNQRINEVTKLRKPDGIKTIIMEERTLPFAPLWAKAIFYYGDYAQKDVGFWNILLDAGETGVWLRFHGLITAKEEMLQWVLEVAKTYQENTMENTMSKSAANWFCLKYGALNIPYKHQESTYTRFEGHPLDLKLEIEMNETHIDEPKEEGLLARTAAAILTGFAFGVDIKKIRSHKRTVAGLDGEEQVVRMKDKDGTELDFTWRYAGKKDSGEYPKIVVTMESPDGKLEEKLKLWDAILDSMKPLYKQ